MPRLGDSKGFEIIRSEDVVGEKRQSTSKKRGLRDSSCTPARAIGFHKVTRLIRVAHPI